MKRCRRFRPITARYTPISALRVTCDSASLAPAATAPMQYPAAVDPQRQPLPTENFEQMMFELGGDAATVMYPDNGTLSMWSNAPAGFE